MHLKPGSEKLCFNFKDEHAVCWNGPGLVRLKAQHQVSRLYGEKQAKVSALFPLFRWSKDRGIVC